MQSRYTLTHLETWRRDGVVLIPDFFTPEEVAAVTADFSVKMPCTLPVRSSSGPPLLPGSSGIAS